MSLEFSRDAELARDYTGPYAHCVRYRVAKNHSVVIVQCNALRHLAQQHGVTIRPFG
jgi:hypothetical protein